MYRPADFGELALLYTVASVVSAVGCLRFDLAIPGATTEERRALIALCLGSAAGLSLVVGGACLVPWQEWVSSPLAAFTDRPLLLMSIVLSVGTYQVAISDLVRVERFRTLGAVRLSQGALFALLPMLPGLSLVWGLALSFVPGGVLAVRGLSASTRAEIVQTASAFRKFPLYSLPGALLDVAGTSAVIWILTASYGVETAGQYTQAQRLIGAPLLLISTALFQVLLRKSAEKFALGESLSPLLISTASRLGLAAGLVLVATLLVGEPVIGLLLGPGWRVDAPFLALIVVAVGVRACVSPLSSCLVTTRNLGALTAWQAIYFVTTFTILPFASANLGFDGFLMVYAGHEVILYGVYFLLILKVSGRRS
jgi:O-antigen/teichoic acid export membrane protein